MKIAPFTIEQFFDRYEFTTPYLLCASDCESMSVAELLELAEMTPADLGALHLGYSPAPGIPKLRAAVSQTYRRIDPEQILILTTPEEGIYITMRALLEPRDHIVVMTPAYDSLLNMAAHITDNVSRWEIQPTPTGWRVDLAQLAEMVTAATKLLIVNFPHNPTGYLPDQETLAAIIDVARQHDVWLFCDEMYRGLEVRGAATLPSAADLYRRAVVLAGLSKVHGLPGLRAGWLVVQDEALFADLINWKHYTSICAPAPSQFLALAALQVQPQLIARNRGIIEQNLALADAFFARWPQMFTWRPLQAGSVALVGLERPSATDYCHQLAAEAGVLLLPSSCLGYGDRHVRLGLGRTDFAANLVHYERYLRAQAGAESGG